MQTEVTTIETPVDAVDAVDVKPLVMLQLIGAATGQNKMLSVRALYANARKYAGIEMSFGDFLHSLHEFRDDLSARAGELGVDVNYVGLKSET